MVDLTKLMNKSVDDIEVPKPVPQGVYFGVIAGAPDLSKTFKRKDKDTGQETEVALCEIDINLMEPGPGVDLDLLASVGGLTRKDGKPKSVRITYYLEDDSIYKLKKLGEALNLEFRTLMDLMPQLAGQQVQCLVGHRPDKDDPETIYNTVKKLAAVKG